MGEPLSTYPPEKKVVCLQTYMISRPGTVGAHGTRKEQML